ncbi:MAG: Zn-dependent hydrolase [Actinobacteria bacterium]|nr:Zn-dependent hydrolase [Actinomycetota bacterium]
MDPPQIDIDAERVIADLRELDRRTGGPDGARRTCWTGGWREARAFLDELLEEIDLKSDRDSAGNLWAFAPSENPDAPALAMGSHLDSVPRGGWLDGALGVMAAVGVLRAWRHAGVRSARPLAVVDWADEEGARFGRSLFGSSAFSGSLEVEPLRELRDADGCLLPDALAENGVELESAPQAASMQPRLAAYLELHIEQGPVLEAQGASVAAVSGCLGVERHRFRFRGQASHAGTTPMEARRDAGLAAAAAALGIERIPDSEGGLATTGALVLDPGAPTVIAGEATLVVDLRNSEAEALARMLEAAHAAAHDAAAARACTVEFEPIWRVKPIAFDPELVEEACAACQEVGGVESTLPSGALHDATELARIVPTAMLFCPSLGGLSHTSQEDTADEDLLVAIAALGVMASRLQFGG